MVESTTIRRLQARVLEGSRAIAEAVRLCRPQVIAAYPITPQTHIVEGLAQMVADGELAAEYLNVESEHSAASAILGASAVGARAYTATSSQGLALMVEVLYNISGLRLPVVLTVANRALSSPLNIKNDHSDAMLARDAGWIIFFAEDNQEAVDLHIQAFRIGEDPRVVLPVMVNVDGYTLTHTFEPVVVPSQKEVDAFLPPYQPLQRLDPEAPLSFGLYAESDSYTESRYMQHQALLASKEVVREIFDAYGEQMGRSGGGLIEGYHTEDADIVLLAMGSMVSTMKDLVDEMRQEGQRVGVLKVCLYRPFPGEEITRALAGIPRVAVVEKAVAPGGLGILAADVRAALYGHSSAPSVSSFVVGLGGRDVTKATLRRILTEMAGPPVEQCFADLRPELFEGASLP